MEITIDLSDQLITSVTGLSIQVCQSSFVLLYAVDFVKERCCKVQVASAIGTLRHKRIESFENKSIRCEQATERLRGKV